MNINDDVINDVVKDLDLESNMLKDVGNGLLLTDKYIEVLNRYDFDYKKYSNIDSLIYDIEDYLNNNATMDNEDLEWVESELAERNYYQNTKK